MLHWPSSNLLMAARQAAFSFGFMFRLRWLRVPVFPFGVVEQAG